MIYSTLAVQRARITMIHSTIVIVTRRQWCHLVHIGRATPHGSLCFTTLSSRRAGSGVDYTTLPRGATRIIVIHSAFVIATRRSGVDYGTLAAQRRTDHCDS
jgi:hypothetical protein